MTMKRIIAGLAVAFALTACSGQDPEPVADTADIAMCRELSGSWEARWADESSENHRRIGEAFAGSENANLQTAGELFLGAAEYPRNPDGTITLDAAREHLADALAMVKAVGTGCEEVGVELSAELRAAVEAAEQIDGIPTGEETGSPVTVAIGGTATMSGDQGGRVTVKVTVASPEQYTVDPDGFEPENGVYLVLDVTVVGVEGSYLFTDIFFSFEAADGTPYYAALTGFTPALETGTVAAGEQLNGKLVFDLPTAAIAGGRVLIEGIGFDMTELPGAIWTL